MEKNAFREKVINWLKENNIDISHKKVRVYKYRGSWEVRIYGESMEIPNSRKSFRERKEERDDQRHGSYGIHSQTITTYTHINEEDFKFI